MTDTYSDCECSGTCTPKAFDVSSDEGASKNKTVKAKFAKFGAGIIALCAVCCAVPSGLLALGLIGLGTGAYLSVGLKAATAVIALLGLGYLLLAFLRKNHKKAP